MVRASIALGYEYIAITDHSERSAATRSLRRDDVARQAEAIAAKSAELATKSEKAARREAKKAGSVAKAVEPQTTHRFRTFVLLLLKG